MGTLRGATGKAKRKAAARARPRHRGSRTEKLAVPRRENKDAVEQQAATASVLKALAAAGGDVQPVLDAIVAHAHRLCGADYNVLYRYDGEFLSIVADKHMKPQAMPLLRQMYPARPQKDKFVDVAVLEGRPVHSADIPNDPRFPGNRNPYSQLTGRRAALAVPLLRGHAVIGAIACGRVEAKPFSKREVHLLKTFADQAVIAIENARLFNETKEALERQTATAEILKVIARSPSDVQPVFDTIVRSAVRLCGSLFGFVSRFDGEKLHLAAQHNFPRAALETAKRSYPSVPDRSRGAGRAILTKSVARIEDIYRDPDYYKAYGKKGGWRRVLAVPMMRDGVPLGTISVAWADPGPIPESQVELLKTFADQAVIAIENVRLFNETKEALDRQTSISEVLAVISGSPADLSPILEAVASRAAKLCDATDARIFLVDGQEVRHVAGFGDLPVRTPVFPLHRGTSVGTAIMEGKVVHVRDIVDEADKYPLSRDIAHKAGWRTTLNVPLMREGKALGAVALRRREVRPFSERQIALLKLFADQAAIAIENVRLFNETKESLERQTATADILKVISSSPTDIQPVFDAIARNATKLCESVYANVFRYDGERLYWEASEGGSQEVLGELRKSYPMPPNPSRVVGRVVLGRRAVHVEDTLSDPGYDKAFARQLPHRRILGVPLLRAGKPVGAITVAWTEPGPILPRHEELLKTFADQAVIAIENARLFNETKEALEQQTGTAQVLSAISGSPTDVAPVYRTILENATRLCDASFAAVFLYDGVYLRAAAHLGAGPALARFFDENQLRPGRETATRLAALEQRVVHVEDLLNDPQFSPGEAHREEKTRTVLSVPMMREDALVGVITVWRREPRRFSGKQVALLKTFADQAVIAIENVRLFNETKEALEQQTATADILKVISGSPTDIQPVLDAVATNAARLCEAADAVIALRHGDEFGFAAHYGSIPITGTRAVTRQTVAGRAMLEGRQIHVPDLQAATDEFPKGSEYARQFGYHTLLVTPLMREGAAIGAILIRRIEARPFSDAHLALLRTFADQAVIAIENVRLFNETKEALDQQKASAEVLGAISGSIADTKPVFEKILASCERLFEGELVGVTLADGDTVRLAAYHGPQGDQLKNVYPLPLTRESGTGWAILNAQIAHFPDIEAEGVPPGVVAGCRTLKVRAIVFAPMLFEGKGIGAIWVARAQASAFTDKQIAQLRTFADQAVIAIQNARLVNETREALEQQTATAEVLKVISGSPTDVEPVFDAILRSAVNLCNAELAAVFPFDGELVHLGATHNWSPEALEYFSKIYPCPPSPHLLSGRTILTKEVVKIADSAADENYDPQSVVTGHWRRMLGAPMLREGEPLGAFVVAWRDPGETPQRQVELLQTFADQAAIAIENVRLFNETKEALDQQRASAEVLRVISSSVADTEPVFEIILRSCERLFAGLNVGINVVDEDGKVHIAAYHGHGREELERHFPVPLSDASGSGAAILRRAIVHYPDVEAPEVPEYARRGGRIAGSKSVIFAPMLWEERAIGAIFVGRDFTGPFSDKEIALLKTFADQAVIAIQNARLFREIQEKSAQLEVANKHKSDFLANMSHELRTPLNAIIGFSEVLSDRMFGEVNEKQAEYLKDIHESGRHLLSLINDILDLSKIEAGRMELELSSFDLPSAVSNAMTLVRERAQRHGIRLGLEMDPRLGEFQADERKVKQILLNLLSNAVKFTPDGGKVDVCTRKMDGKVEIAVRDTGIGIAAEDHAAVFEEFKQVGRDYTRKAEGTGLGLALTRRLVELHGGEIALESALGKGATFTVKLPLR